MLESPADTLADALSGNSDFLFVRNIFTGQKRCQDLGNAGRIKLGVGILGIKNCFCIYIHKNCRLCFDIWAGWPAVNGVGISCLVVVTGMGRCDLCSLSALAVRNWCCGDNRITVLIISISSSCTMAVRL